MRGVNQQRIFGETADYERFLRCLSEVKLVSGFKLLAYCLMSNHVHLLLKEGSEPLSQIFMRLGAKYVPWFNRKYDRSGHLFQDRFKSGAVESDAYFIAALIYIYQNPVKAGLCAQSQDYRWSSRRRLGTSGIVDEKELFSIVSLEQILEHECEVFPINPLAINARQQIVLSDDEVFVQMKVLGGVASTSEFQSLCPEKQAEVFKELHQYGVSIRQFSRLSGLGRGLIQRW